MEAAEKEFTIRYDGTIASDTKEVTFQVAAKEGMESTTLNIVGLCKVDGDGSTDLTSASSYVARVFGQSVGEITLSNISGLCAGDKVRFVVRYMDSGNVTRTIESKTYTVEQTVEPIQPEVSITNERVDVETTSVSVSMTYDPSASLPLLTIYTYDGDSFDPAADLSTDEQRRSFIAIRAINSDTGNKLTLSLSSSLESGNKVVAILWTGGITGSVLAQSEPVTVQAAAAKSDPAAFIRNGDKLTAGKPE